MIDIESKIISYREDTNDYRLCLTREEINKIKQALNNNNKINGILKAIQFSIDDFGASMMRYSGVIDDILEQLKEQNNQIIKDLAPKGCVDMPKEIVCNCTKEQNK